MFVETGTFLGDTVAALKKSCKKIVSIEIDPALYQICLKRFENDPNVELLLGDCIERLPRVLEMLGESAVFWLDGHWSGGATGLGQVDDPIMISLSQIAGHTIKTHTIMIDDARCFDGSNHRPDLSEVLGTLQNINRSYRILVHHDIIVATL